MPETEAAQTPLAQEIITKTAEAVKDIGFDAGFDAEVEAALTQDREATSRIIESKPSEGDGGAPTPEPAPPKPRAEPKKEPMPVVPDIPDALLAPKKPADAPPEEDREKAIVEQTKGMSEKARSHFRALEKAKHEAEERARKLPDLEKELATYKSQKPDTSEVEALKKQVTELDEALAKAALTEHPKFKAHYTDKLQAEIDIAKAVAGDSAKEVEVLLALPDSKGRNQKLSEIIEALDPIESGKLQRVVDNVDRINADKAKEMANWKENKVRMDDMSRQEQQQLSERHQQEVEHAYKAVEKQITDDVKGIEIFRKVDGNDEWNTKVEQRLEKVRKINSVQLGPRDIAEMAAWAISGNEYREMFLTQRVLVKRLQQELTSLRGGEPDLGEGGAAVPEAEEKGDWIDSVVAGAQKAGLVR